MGGTYSEDVFFSRNSSWHSEPLMSVGSRGGSGASDWYQVTGPNLEETDPLFVDEAGGDLNLRPYFRSEGLEADLALCLLKASQRRIERSRWKRVPRITSSQHSHNSRKVGYLEIH